MHLRSLGSRAERAGAREPGSPGKLRGEIELRGVGFRYGNRSVVENVDLTIAPGEMIGLVGPSGAGKSTLVNLVCRFYDVTAGSVLIDGVDVRQFPVCEYRQHIGVVLQDPFLFFGTIAENIAYGRPDATREEIVAAARVPRPTNSSCGCPMGMTRSWASAARRCQGASGSVFRSPSPC